MAQAGTRAPVEAVVAERVKPPSVLVVLVAHDAADWVRQCLLGLSKQTHPRIGVMAVDNASTDGSGDVLTSALGAERVIRLDRNVGFAGGVAEALKSPAAVEADYVLLLHDDTVLAPDAITCLVQAAERYENVGVVGPKVLDWDEPRRLREIGMSTDRFGYPYSPLEDDEIDQGQYDRIREVLFVSSAAMLISRRAWTRVGRPDERYVSHHEDLDFCWRARLAGFRVLMAPNAVARHRGAGAKGERDRTAPARVRYHRERAALASVLKNYSLFTLLWLLPLYFVQGLARVLLFAVSRRFEDAYQVLAAWGWNLIHLPGTVRRRARAQAVRSVRDRVVKRYMAPARMRLGALATVAGRFLVGRESNEDDVRPSARAQVVAFGLAHPVTTACTLAVLVALLAYRHLAVAAPLTGGALTRFPSSWTAFFSELASNVRHGGLGGSAPASPALAALGAGSLLTFGSPALLQKLLLLGLPLAAAWGCYRAVRSITSATGPSVVAAGCYGLSTVLLEAVSDGRIPALVFLAGLPWLATKFLLAFDPNAPVRPGRWVIGAAAGLAGLAAFYPAAALAAVLVTVWAAVVPTVTGRRAKGVGLSVAALGGACLLAFPVTLNVLRGGGAALSEPVGRVGFWALLRGSLGPGPGSWPVALYLPLAAALALLFVTGRGSRPAVWAALAGISGVFLADLAGAGYLPAALSNPLAYVAVATFAFAMLVGLGLAQLTTGVARQAFGHRQLGGALMALVLGVGLVGQAYQAARGGWAVGGPDRLPTAYSAVAAGAESYRLLWLGRWTGAAFPPPGGIPDGRVAARADSVRFAVTSSWGQSALDVARPAFGPGYEALRTALSEILTGDTRHGGALLAPFGVRFVLARTRDLPPDVVGRLAAQLDMDQLPEQGLTIFRNERAVPTAAEVSSPAWGRAALANGGDRTFQLPRPRSAVLAPEGDVYRGAAGARGSVVYLGDQFDSHWSMSASGVRAVAPHRAFGWAMAWPATPSGAALVVRRSGGGVRTFELALLAVLWAPALWATRRPAGRG
ncbi:MAG TPA: hypothetical protein DIU14_08610 [Actinobacteria bacterium]|nr:hypothetical protein [Actinomycetota bacterium]